MKNSWPIALILVTVAGCTTLPVELKYYPVGSNTALLDSTRVIASTDSLVFDAKFSFLDLMGHYDIGEMRLEDFTFTSAGTYKVLDFSEGISTGHEQISVTILEDQSGDYQSVDPYNYRSKMINRFCQDMTAPASYRLGAYSSQGKIIAPVEFATSGYTSDWSSVQGFLFGLPARTGGKSNLYDALVESLAQMPSLSTPHKSIVVLAHAVDEGSASSLDQVISAALAGQVNIHVLFLGKKESVGDLPQLSSRTGGMMAVMGYDLEMVTVFNHLHRLLAGQKYAYTMRVSFHPESGPLTGSGYLHALSIVDYIDNKGFNPVVIYTPVP